MLEAAQRHIHSSSQLFKLAQDAFKLATPADGPKHLAALTAAFELGLQVSSSSISPSNFSFIASSDLSSADNLFKQFVPRSGL